MRHSMEICYRIWNDDTGDHIAVTDDADGLGLFEIRQHDDQGKIMSRITLSKEELPLIISALQKKT